MATMTTHRELTVTKMVTASCDWAVTWAVIELGPSHDWAVIVLKMPWLSCDLAVTELWPRRDWAVTSPSRDWAVIIGPQSRDHRGHCELTVSSPWPFIFSWDGFPWLSARLQLLQYVDMDGWIWIWFWQDYKACRSYQIPQICFVTKLIVTCRLCVIYVSEDDNVLVMITWNTLSTGRERPLNFITHSFTPSIHM